ncbi:MAG: GNAT family N-acetyltransferase [Rhizobiaceae bacterium]|nr:GNAT family N-acetyltransferase [Rhizobiaceae bacterium]
MENGIEFRHVETDSDMERSFAVMRELRPHIASAEQFVERVRRQQAGGYFLLAAWTQGEVVGLAGYRHLENLIYGAFTYVDDLVVRPTSQRGNIGGRLLDEVRQKAKTADSVMLVLDTGLGNAFAQRFYFRQGLLSRGLHFSQVLS